MGPLYAGVTINLSISIVPEDEVEAVDEIESERFLLRGIRRIDRPTDKIEDKVEGKEKNSKQ